MSKVEIQFKNGKIKSNCKLTAKQRKDWQNSLNSLKASFEVTESRIKLARKRKFKTAAEILDFIMANNLIIPVTDCANVQEVDFAEDMLHEFLYGK